MKLRVVSQSIITMELNEQDKSRFRYGSKGTDLTKERVLFEADLTDEQVEEVTQTKRIRIEIVMAPIESSLSSN